MVGIQPLPVPPIPLLMSNYNEADTTVSGVVKQRHEAGSAIIQKI